MPDWKNAPVSQPCFPSFSDFSFCQQRETEKTKSPISLLSPVLVPVSARITKKPRLVARGLKSSLCFFKPAGSISGKHNTGKGQESISGQSNQADGEKG